MDDIQRVLVVGTGAIGAALASIIQRACPGCVSVLAEGERLERYRRDGFVVNGETMQFNLAPPVDTAGQAGAPAGSPVPSGFDLIVLAVKYHHLALAIDQMRGHVGPQTMILSLLNGISSEELLGAAFGPGPGAPEDGKLPLYAMSLGIDAVRQDNKVNFSTFGKIHFGDRFNTPGAYSQRVLRLSRFFDRTKVPYVIPENMLHSLWYKFMMNVGINQASAVLKAPYGTFQTEPHARAVMMALMGEVVALSRVMGMDLEESDMQKIDEPLFSLHPGGYTSMCQDVMAGRKTEVEMLAGELLELGRRHGVATPVNEVFFNLIKAIEAGYTGS
ncbi:MAG: ketopantoate reductase family protein [Spirochaetota bacterium]